MTRDEAIRQAHEALEFHAAGEFSYPAVLAQFTRILDAYASHSDHDEA
jgi:hypothetical protein